MASEMADSQQRSLNCLREEMRNEMRNEVVHFKEEIRKEVEAGLKLDQVSMPSSPLPYHYLNLNLNFLPLNSFCLFDNSY